MCTYRGLMSPQGVLTYMVVNEYDVFGVYEDQFPQTLSFPAHDTNASDFRVLYLPYSPGLQAASNYTSTMCLRLLDPPLILENLNSRWPASFRETQLWYMYQLYRPWAFVSTSRSSLFHIFNVVLLCSLKLLNYCLSLLRWHRTVLFCARYGPFSVFALWMPILV